MLIFQQIKYVSEFGWLQNFTFILSCNLSVCQYLLSAYYLLGTVYVHRKYINRTGFLILQTLCIMYLLLPLKAYKVAQVKDDCISFSLH